MSLDRSLKTSGNLSQHRNVLSRPERIARLKERGKFADDGEPMGLQKVANRKVSAGGKATKKADAAEAAPGATPAAPAAAAAPAAKAAGAKKGKK